MPPMPKRPRSGSRNSSSKRIATTRTRATTRSKTSPACEPDAVSDDAIPAATLIVVREAVGDPPQLLMVERAEGMAFAAGALVFPGGRIDEADGELAAELGVEGALIAAVRETIEETAVPVALTPTPDAEKAFDLQQQLAGNQGFGQLLRASG